MVRRPESGVCISVAKVVNGPAFATIYHSMTDPAQVSPPPKTTIST